MEQRSEQTETTHGAGRRRLLVILAAALFAVSAVVILLVMLLPCDGEVTIPTDQDGGVQTDAADVADAADATPDAAPAADLAPDQARRPRGTRRITERELRGLQRRHRGLISACYRLAARRDPATTPSRVSITVTLGDSGRVRRVGVDAGGARRLRGCLSRAIRGWRFSNSLRAQQVSFQIVRPR